MEHKLGIVIQAANQGNQDIFQRNKEEGWAKSIDDLRTPMGGLTFSKDNTEPVIYVKFLGKEGYLLVLTRVRDKDCVKNRVKRANIVRSTLC